MSIDPHTNTLLFQYKLFVKKQKYSVKLCLWTKVEDDFFLDAVGKESNRIFENSKFFLTQKTIERILKILKLLLKLTMRA